MSDKVPTDPAAFWREFEQHAHREAARRAGDAARQEFERERVKEQPPAP